MNNRAHQLRLSIQGLMNASRVVTTHKRAKELRKRAGRLALELHRMA